MDRPVEVVMPWTVGGFPREVLDFLVPLHAQVPGLKVTCFFSPGPCGPLPPDWPSWIRAGLYGWEGYPGEALSWTRQEAADLCRRALEMGYEPVMFPPPPAIDEDVAGGLGDAGVRIFYPGERGLAKRIGGSFDPFLSGLEYPPRSPLFSPENLSRYDEFAFIPGREPRELSGSSGPVPGPGGDRPGPGGDR